ncbi:hypothetical protein TEA_022383 [Camellia sinensis var. sinensis]|uniref:O-methyltransferase C-terminal domain-containing protein n=1 Tax=Camellia sinensis var. sinensis TaxID=542762 RepID=A0A4S4EWC8_CAMSN|nr:hypothetical protein TEA_022383 [Camellia sinensis var. sinensis]
MKIDPNHGDQEGYVLTPSSKLLIKSEMANLSPFVQAMVDPVLVTPWQFLGDWFRRLHMGLPWGGTGINARIISEAFPGIKCTVFDLPHVVENLPEEKNLNYVGGDMFQSFPFADAFFFKNCVKILKRCREAIPSKEDGGKVIIIDMVVDGDRDEHDITETKLVFDILMMVLVTGRERSEKEWEKIFLEAGFSHYKITPIFGLRSLIEIYP